MKKLNNETLTSRREFLKKARNIALKGVVPAVAVYLINKSTPPLFGQSVTPPEPI